MTDNGPPILTTMIRTRRTRIPIPVMMSGIVTERRVKIGSTGRPCGSEKREEM